MEGEYDYDAPGGDDGEYTWRKLTSKVDFWVAALVICIAVVCLPDAIATQSDAVCALREYLRKHLRDFARFATEGPVFRLLMFISRKCSCGRLVSECRPPLSLGAKVLSATTIQVHWSANLSPNAGISAHLHEERYIVAWRRVSQTSDSSAPTAVGTPVDKGSVLEARWQEALVDANLHHDTDDRSTFRQQWVARIRGLPAQGCVIVRVCAVNNRGRSAWSTEEVEVHLGGDTSSKLGDNGGARRNTDSPGANGLSNGRNVRVLLREGAQQCMRCRTSEPATVSYVDVVCRPLFSSGCKHGPFCPRCRSSMSAQVVPSCVCRGVIGTWREEA